MDLILKKEKKWRKRYYDKGFKDKIKRIIGKRHLEFGCGFGFLAYLIARDFKAEVVGVDRNREVISSGRERYKLKNLKFEHSVKGMFDSISMFFVVHHLTEDEFKDVLKHLRGKILIFDFRKVSKLKFKRWYDKKIAIGEYKESFEESYEEHNKWPTDRFKIFMESLGFRTIECYEAGDYWFFYLGSNN